MSYKDEVEFMEDQLDDLVFDFMRKHPEIEKVWDIFVWDKYQSYLARVQQAREEGEEC